MFTRKMTLSEVVSSTHFLRSGVRPLTKNRGPGVRPLTEKGGPGVRPLNESRGPGVLHEIGRYAR